MGQKVKLTEEQLRNIIRRCVNEAWNQEQFANFAGQADGALSTIGGKIRGLVNPSWRKRKEQQKNKFANIAANNSGVYRNSVISGKDDNVNVTGKHFRNGTLYDVDLDKCAYDEGYDDNAPFKIRRSQFNVIDHKDGSRPEYVHGKRHGELTEPNEYRRQARAEYGDDEKRLQSEFGYDSPRYKMTRDANMLNRSYDNGKMSAMGKLKGMKGKDGKPIGGTGMNNGHVRKSGKKN